jgi:hypothetical protein
MRPDFQSLTSIKACQAAANTTFCWPPNGTRICVPTYGIPFYWPPAYYDPDSKLAIDYNVTSKYFILSNNTGNRTQAFTPSMFDEEAEAIPGKVNEKSMKMYFRERRMNDQSDPKNLENHDGPTLILVKTAAFTTISVTVTSTRKPKYDSDDDDDDRHLVGGAVAGIIVSVIVVVIIFFTCCCYACGCTKGRRSAKPTIDKAEHTRIIAQGTELMQQRGGAQDESSRQRHAPGREEEARAETPEPPPKYTP